MNTNRPVWLEQPDALALPPPAPALRLAIGRDVARLFRAANSQYQPERDYALHPAPAPTRARLIVSDPSAQANVWRQWEIGEIGAPVDGATLAAAALPQNTYVVEGLIPRGLTILAGRPKEGKSRWIREVACAVARGEPTYGRATTAGTVLYLDLESDYATARADLATITAAPPADLHIVCALDQGDAGLTQLRGWIELLQPVLIVLDVLQRWRGPRASSYARDYDDSQKLKTLADEAHAALVVLTHTRKSAAKHPLDSIAGSTGLTGAADAILVLARQGNAGALYSTGKTIAETLTPLTFTGGRWFPARGAPQIGHVQPRRLTAPTRTP